MKLSVYMSVTSLHLAVLKGFSRSSSAQLAQFPQAQNRPLFSIILCLSRRFDSLTQVLTWQNLESKPNSIRCFGRLISLEAHFARPQSSQEKRGERWHHRQVGRKVMIAQNRDPLERTRTRWASSKQKAQN